MNDERVIFNDHNWHEYQVEFKRIESGILASIISLDGLIINQELIEVKEDEHEI